MLAAVRRAVERFVCASFFFFFNRLIELSLADESEDEEDDSDEEEDDADEVERDEDDEELDIFESFCSFSDSESESKSETELELDDDEFDEDDLDDDLALFRFFDDADAVDAIA